jgi:alanyl-tRNA synthetase
MQCHSAEHILSGLFFKYHSLTNVGFHLGKTDVTMDISAPLSREELDNIERLANEIVFENAKISARFPSPEELQSLNYRSKLDLKENVRIVTIGKYDSCACCAPHVSYTGEIGIIKILDSEKLRGGMRLHITAGRRALRAFDGLYKTALKVSDLISTPKSELSAGVGNLLSNLAKTKAEYEKFRLSSFLDKADSVPKTDGNAVIYFEGALPSELREIANLLHGRVGEYLVLLSGIDGNLQYVITTKSAEVKDVIRKINEKLSGRGGGKGNMASGTFSASVSEVKAYFK